MYLVGSGCTTVAFGCVGILFLAGDFVFFSHVLGDFAHMTLQELVPQTVLQNTVQQLLVAVAQGT